MARPSKCPITARNAAATVPRGLHRQKRRETDVVWSEADYMFVDMTPGTGDDPLTVFQSLPVVGIVVVTSPQELVGMIVEKAVKMAEMLHIAVSALVENMSYFECSTCHERHYIFGRSHISRI